MSRKKSYSFYAITILIVSLFTFLVACSSKKKSVVAEIGDEKIYLGEFEKQFLKTVNNIDTARNQSMQEKKEFLDLLIKFRLKVKDARDKGFLNSPEIQNDLNDYKKNFISTFLIDKEVVEPYIEKLYERKMYEVRASHILVNLNQTPTPEDSVKAYKKADDILARLKNGDAFETVAKEMSDDQTAQQNAGDLYYFTGGMTVPEFEDIVYDLKVNEYNKKAVRTMFGLHIVKLTDKKKRNDGIRASHILLQDQKDSLGRTIDSVQTYQKALTTLERLKKGEDFSKVAAEVSQDPGSNTRGGDLGFFDRRRMVQPFDSAAFSLKIGEISGLVRTPFGWHIIKLTEIKEYESFDKQKENLKAEFKKGQQYRTEYAKFVEKVRKDYNFAIEENSFKTFAAKFDSTRTIGSYNLDSLFNNDERQAIIAKYKGGEVKVQDLITYNNTNKDFGPSAALSQALKRMVESSSELPILNLMSIKEKIDKDDDYVDLLREYENGLMSFKIDQEELWSKIKITNEDMLKYYDANTSKFSYTDSTGQKIKTFEEVKSEISSTLQQDKFKDMEKVYVDNLRQKYPVKIYENILEKAFKD